jgi:hypothetical protein
MKNKIYKIMDNMNNKEFKVVRVDKNEFELDNGDIYPHGFELDEDITVEEFQMILDQTKNSIIEHIKKLTNNSE